MSEETFGWHASACVNAGDVSGLNRVCVAYASSLDRLNQTGIRNIDYMLYWSMGHQPDMVKTAEFCRILFDHGADPNRSFYQQTQTGFLNMAAEWSLPLTQLFVERGEPLGPGTDYVGWLVRSMAGEMTWGCWQRPDGERVEVLTIAPLYAEEIALERKIGQTELLSQLRLWAGLHWFVEGRQNVATQPSE